MVQLMPLPSQDPQHLLPHLNPDLFHLYGTGLSRLSWKRGRKTGVVVVVVVAAAAAAALSDVLLCGSLALQANSLTF